MQCYSHFRTGGNILRCQRETEHKGFHESGDWGWADSDPDSLPAPATIEPEMKSLREIKANLTTLTVSVAALNANHKGLAEQIQKSLNAELNIANGINALAGKLDAIGNALAGLLVLGERKRPSVARKRGKK